MTRVNWDGEVHDVPEPAALDLEASLQNLDKKMFKIPIEEVPEEYREQHRQLRDIVRGYFIGQYSEDGQQLSDAWTWEVFDLTDNDEGLYVIVYRDKEGKIIGIKFGSSFHCKDRVAAQGKSCAARLWTPQHVIEGVPQSVVDAIDALHAAHQQPFDTPSGFRQQQDRHRRNRSE